MTGKWDASWCRSCGDTCHRNRKTCGDLHVVMGGPPEICDCKECRCGRCSNEPDKEGEPE